MVVDFARVDAAVKPLVELCDHRRLNAIVRNPTSERLAGWFIGRLRALPHLHAVLIGETCRSECEVLAEDCP